MFRIGRVLFFGSEVQQRVSFGAANWGRSSSLAVPALLVALLGSRLVRRFRHLPRSLKSTKSSRRHHLNFRSTTTALVPSLAGFSLFSSTKSSKSEGGRMGEDGASNGASGVADTIQKADQFYDANDFKQVYETLLTQKDHLSHCELQWKLARAARDLSQLDATPKERKEQLFYEGLDFAENAVKADENNFAAHKWKGVLLSDVSSFEGYKKQISNAYVIRDEFATASRLNPQDALPHFLLGEWCYSVSDMGWMQRKFAQALFGDPPKSTFEEAYSHYTKAEEVKSGFYVGNYVSLGKTCVKLKRKEEARSWFTKATQFKSENEKDDKLIAEAKELLKTT